MKKVSKKILKKPFLLEKPVLFFMVLAVSTFTLISTTGYLNAKTKSPSCETIQSGELKDTKGRTISVGYDQWGYNYEAHIFNGIYDNYTRPNTPVSGGDRLQMKWNDAWLSNKSCDGDAKLDRHFGFPTYIGSGAWLTNHAEGTYTQGDETCSWNDFVKIVAAPADAVKTNGIWYSADGMEIGPDIWGEFAIIQEQSSDPCGNANLGLVNYKSKLRSGLGNW